MFESLEARVLLASPSFLTLPTDQVFTTHGALTIPVIASDPDGDHVTITATSDNPNLDVFAPTGNRFARLNFTTTGGTSVGSILVELFEGRSGAATDRFITLSTNRVLNDGTLDPTGEPFYTDVLVHRVEPNFVFQTGDAQSSNGTGGSPLGDFDDVFDPHLAFEGPGVLAMANSGPNTNDSQWFITDGATPHLTPNNQIYGHMVFGQMIGSASQQVYDGIMARGSGNTILESVTIVDANTINAGTLTFRSVDGAGVSGNVTIRLDDGTGNIVEHTIDVTALSINDVGPIRMSPGESRVVDVLANASLNDGLDISMALPPTSVRPLADFLDEVDEVDINIPSTWTGFFKLDFSGTIDGSPSPATQRFDVFSETDESLQGLSFVPVRRSAAQSGINTYSSLLEDGRMYVANGTSGIEIWDVSNPRVPVQLGVHQTGGLSRDIFLDGDVLYVADANGNGRTGRGVVALDVSDPANIVELDSISPASQINSITGQGNVLYLAAGTSGLITVNISNPADMKTLDQINDAEGSVSVRDARDIIVDGNTAYLLDRRGSDAKGGIVIYDVTNPSSVNFVFREFTQGTPVAFDRKDDLLYVATGTPGLRIFDVSNPSNPDFVGALAIGGSPSQVTVDGDVAYVGTTVGVAVVDITDPASPTFDHVYRLSSTVGEMDIRNGVLAIPVFSEGLVLTGAFGSTPPQITANIEDQTVDEDSDPLTIDLLDFFDDFEGSGGGSLTFAAVTDDQDQIAAVVNGSTLTVSFLPNANGQASLTVRATDSEGDFAEQTFAIDITPMPDAPVVTSPLPDRVAYGDSPTTISIPLDNHFDDPDSGQLSYAVVNSNSQVVVATVFDKVLRLQFPGSTDGAVTITVTATDGEGATVDDVFTVTTGADNDAPVVANPLASVVVGEGTAPLAIDLSDVFTDANPGDTLIYSLANQNAGLVTASIDGTTLRLTPRAGQTGTTRIVIRATDSNGDMAQTEFNFTAEPLTEVVLDNDDTEVEFVDADGTATTISIKRGQATFRFNSSDLPGVTVVNTSKGFRVEGDNLRLEDIDFTDSSLKTQLKFNASGGDGFVDVTDITSDTVINKIIADVVRLTGSLVVAGGVVDLALGEAAGAQIDLGDVDGRKGMKVRIQQAEDIDFDTQTPVLKLDLGQVAGESRLAAPSVNRLRVSESFTGDLVIAGGLSNGRVAGDFTGDIEIDAIKTMRFGSDLRGNFDAATVKSLRVDGDWSDAAANVTDADGKTLGKLVVAGSMNNVRLDVAGNLGKVTAGRLVNSLVLAGADNGLNGLPTAAALVNNDGGRSIGKLKLTASQGDAMSGSVIAASVVKKLILREVGVDNSGQQFGVAAEQIGSITRDGHSSIKKLNKNDTRGVIDTDGDYRVRLI